MADGQRFQGKDGQQVPEMTPEIVQNISDRYIELYEHITGKASIAKPTPTLRSASSRMMLNYLKA